jgi:hypothetical protein
MTIKAAKHLTLNKLPAYVNKPKVAMRRIARLPLEGGPEGLPAETACPLALLQLTIAIIASYETFSTYRT